MQDNDSDSMASKTLGYLGILMGLIILVLDIYWTYAARAISTFLAVGVIILIADLIWLFVDAKLMKG